MGCTRNKCGHAFKMGCQPSQKNVVQNCIGGITWRGWYQRRSIFISTSLRGRCQWYILLPHKSLPLSGHVLFWIAMRIFVSRTKGSFCWAFHVRWHWRHQHWSMLLKNIQSTGEEQGCRHYDTNNLCNGQDMGRHIQSDADGTDDHVTWHCSQS
jgi:hypothetical protein